MEAMTLEEAVGLVRGIMRIHPKGVLVRNAWEVLDAHLAQPAQAVDVGAIREVIADMRDTRLPPTPYLWCEQLTRALSGEKAGPVGDGVSRIAAERKRQRDVEGWTPEHDAEHKNATLTRAALSYAFFAASAPEVRDQVRHQMPNLWPWEMSWWKPGSDNSHASRIRELVKAGALIAAEIDRLSLPASPTPDKEGA